MTFWPQWPHMTPNWHLTHNIGKGSEADQHVWVLWLCYVTWKSFNILVKMTFWPHMTPNWHLTHNIGKGSEADQHVWVLWLCYVTWKSFNILVKMTFDPSDPKWLHIDIWPYNIGRESQADEPV